MLWCASDPRLGRAELPYRSARQLRVRYFFPSFFLVFTAIASRLSPVPQPPAQDTCERITLLPTLTASYFSFSFPFSSYLGNNNQRLAAAVRHQYASIQS